MTAHLVVGRRSIAAVVADLSLTGARLVGARFAPPGTWVSLTLVAPPYEIEATARVVRIDRVHDAVAVELDRGSVRHQHALAMMLDLIANERPRVAIEDLADLLASEPLPARRLL